MANYKKRKHNKKDINWSTPKCYIKDEENLGRSKKIKKLCKYTKGQHEFIVTHINVSNNYVHPADMKNVKFFSGIDIVFYLKCGCGKKDIKYFGGLFGNIFNNSRWKKSYTSSEHIIIKR